VTKHQITRRQFGQYGIALVLSSALPVNGAFASSLLLSNKSLPDPGKAVKAYLLGTVGTKESIAEPRFDLTANQPAINLDLMTFLLKLRTEIIDYWDLNVVVDGQAKDLEITEKKFKKILELKTTGQQSYYHEYYDAHAVYKEAWRINCQLGNNLCEKEVLDILIAEPFMPPCAETNKKDCDECKEKIKKAKERLSKSRIQRLRNHVIDEFIRLHVARSGFKRFTVQRNSDGSFGDKKGLDFMNYNGYPGGFFT